MLSRWPSVGMDNHEIDLGGEKFVCRIIRTGRQVSIRVPTVGCVEVHIPRGAVVDVDSLIRHHRRWILARHRARQASARMAPDLQAKGWIWVLGEAVPLQQIGLAEPGDVVLRDLLPRWYRAQAHDYLADRVSWWSTCLDISYREFFLANGASRWGYCTPSGRIAIGWRLYQAPQWVIDYVVVHELIHRRFPHHRPSFWNACVQAYPQTVGARAWLAEYGRALIW